jgi:hypothetical protein
VGAAAGCAAQAPIKRATTEAASVVFIEYLTFSFSI